MNEKVRIKQEDKQFLAKLSEHPKAKEMASRRGITENPNSDLTWEETFDLIVPDDAEPVARPEEEMCWRNAGRVKDDIIDLAGENVAVHEAVSEFRERFTETENIQIHD